MMTVLYLKELNQEDSVKEYTFFQEMPSAYGFENEYQGLSYEVFEQAVIPQRLKASKGRELLEGYVPDTYYFLWKDACIVGLFRIRHHLNDFLEHGPGHIGYGILPCEQGKGYATKGLALAIDVCKTIIPEREIYLSCWISNKASYKVMMKNGAYLHHQDEKEYYTRIPIK